MLALIGRDTQNAIVYAAINSVIKHKSHDVVTRCSKKFVDLINDANITVPVAIVALDYVLNTLCSFALNEGLVYVGVKDTQDLN